MSDDAVPQLRPWQRWLFVVATMAGGAAMLAIGISESAQLLHDLRTLPPVLFVTTDIAAFLPLGVGIAAIGLLRIFPPALAKQRRARAGPAARGSRRKARLDLGQWVVATNLVCLLLYPVLVLVLRLTTDSYLSNRGYQQAIVDPGFRAAYLTIRWARRASAPPRS